MTRIAPGPAGLRHPRVSQGCKPGEQAPFPKKFSRRRAFALVAVYVLVAGHFLHWKLAGKTLAPLEFNEATLGLDQGLVTAGLIFMALVLLTAVCFGRFFCGWACHILALQDLCGALLRKLGVKPKPMRSRLLFFLPLAIMAYMFFWTPLRRAIMAFAPGAASWLGALDPFDLRIVSEGQNAAMGSLFTADLWRNLPGSGIMLLTFAVCGFLMIYLLGSRSFCAYVCPYGALFTLTDKLSPGKILLTGDCTACGKCTAACKSGVNVMQEVRTFQKVVDTACFKDMDCVASCPEQALSYGFGKPTVFSGEKPRARPFSFGATEEAGMGAVFLFTQIVFVGLPESMAPWAGRLYGLMPLFLSATLAVITAFVFVIALRVLRRPDCEFQGWVLKKGNLTQAGKIFLACAAAWLLFLGHSALIQYHMFRAGRIVLAQREAADASPERAELSRRAEGHLAAAAGLGFYYRDRRVSRQRAFLALNRGDWELCESQLREAVALQPDHPDSRFQLGWVLAGRGETEAGLRELGRADSLSLEGGRFKGAVWKGALQLVHRGFAPQAADLLERAVLAFPQDSSLRRQAELFLSERDRTPPNP